MERSGTHLVRWVPLRSTHPTFFIRYIIYFEFPYHSIIKLFDLVRTKNL
ncbi:Uncharacterized protein dnm_083090 [Desulfonema magnum]|uniref:Uncharacterized protein n=1 Tax=Desulfonema magnum TaxID=45655 RepID=A0A975GTK2_9BACT|nr:Uncharacterized protein dnm_083090 [Desulfonema magnum]